MRISDWSSDVCSSDLCPGECPPTATGTRGLAEPGRRRSPAPGAEPALDLIQAIGTPEGFFVDEDERRAEPAARDRSLGFLLQLLLDRGVLRLSLQFPGADAQGFGPPRHLLALEKVEA